MQENNSTAATPITTLCKFDRDNAPYGGLTRFLEAEYGLQHDIFDGAPSEWAAERGATHTLDCGRGPGRGTRPAKLMKTRLHVGVDESPEGDIVWQVWTGRQTFRWEA